MITIKESVINSIFGHAQREAPLEACGYLAEKDGIIDEYIPLKNIDQSHEHFTMDPKEQFDAIRAVRLSGKKLRAVYHSHPSTPSRPSQEDIRLAYDPDISYVIASLENGNKVINSFIIKKGTVEKEVMEII